MAVNVLVFCVLALVAEGAIALMLRVPMRLWRLRRAVVAYYMDSDRNIIQFMPECSRYDEQLGYTLKPGRCRFANREFDTTVTVNAAGLRDTNDALKAPPIIALGDSHTMGWGVEDGEAYPKVLESLCGRRVLNAGLSSYGTAREAQLLKRLDMSAVTWVIVQYSANDLRENFLFRETGNRLVPMRPGTFEALQQQQVGRRGYFPGKHVVSFLSFLGRGLRLEWTPPTPGVPRPTGVPGEAVELFLHALRQVEWPSTARLMVFEVPDAGRGDRVFVDALRRVLAAGARDLPSVPITVLDVSTDLTPELYFQLDEHLTRRGQTLLATRLAAAMQCRQG